MSLGQLQAGAIWLISVLNLTDLDSNDLAGAIVSLQLKILF